MAVTWVTSLIGGFAPLTVLAVIVRTEDCSPWLLGLISAVVRHGVNVDAAFLAVVHIIIVPAPSPSHSPVHDFLIPTVLSCLFNCNCHTDLFEEFKTLSDSEVPTSLFWFHSGSSWHFSFHGNFLIPIVSHCLLPQSGTPVPSSLRLIQVDSEAF